MTTPLTYVAIWPIVDTDRPMSALIAEACKDVDTMAALAGVRIAGGIEWAVSENKLVCTAPAEPFDPDTGIPARPAVTGQATPADTIADIERLRRSGWSIRRIAEHVGVSRKTANKYARLVTS